MGFGAAATVHGKLDEVVCVATSGENFERKKENGEKSYLHFKIPYKFGIHIF